MDGFSYLSRDYLIVRTTMMGNERFMITIIVFLFALGFEDYSMNIKSLSRSMICLQEIDLYKRSMYTRDRWFVSFVPSFPDSMDNH